MATRKKSASDLDAQWWRIQRLIAESEERNGRSDRLDARATKASEIRQRYMRNMKQYRKSADAAYKKAYSNAKKGVENGSNAFDRAYNRKYSSNTYMGKNGG